MNRLLTLSFCLPLLCQGQGTRPQSSKFTPVKPVVRTQANPANLRIGSGAFFSYALPEGWRVGENGQFALTLIAPDSKALTIMVGNAGLPPNYPPARFVYDKFMALQPTNLQLSQPRPAQPNAGFSQAFEVDVSYSARGTQYRGVAKCSVQNAYDSAVMAMTAGVSEASQWPGYSTWLPKVANQVAATNGAAFGMRGLMAQNLQNSTAYAQAAKDYREWSQKNWQQVTNDRNASEDRKNAGMREVLGGIQTYSNPYGDNRKVELPLTYKYFWMDKQGNVVGTDDPLANPNQGSTNEWRQMQQAKQ